jgi:transposase
MAARFVNVDRATPMFLPCDLREWVTDDHLVHLILDAVDQIPTGHFRVNHRGTGSEQYPPAMMLALLIYCYATGRFGSRTIEAATHSDVAVRFVCANLHPDHDSICTFRRENKAAFQAAFVTVLQLAHQLRLTRVGTVSVDGTKIQANASKHAAVSYQRAGELITRFQLEVAELTTRAEQADVKEAKESLDIPAELARREKRIESLKQARQIIEAQAKERAAAQQAEHQIKVAERQSQRDAGKKPRGPEPKAPDDKPGDKDQYNFTDPESRIMKAGNGNHFEQAYNAQAAVDEAMLIVGQRVSVAANDKQELAATVQAISPVVKDEVKAVLADSGFYSEAMVRTVEQQSDGTASGLTVYAAVDKQSHHKSIEELLPQPEPEPLAENASAQEKMAHRMKTQVGKTLYKLRKQTVEPVFGIIKEVLGFRRFLMRGREKVSLEWLLVCVSYNLKRMFTLKKLAVTG